MVVLIDILEKILPGQVLQLRNCFRDAPIGHLYFVHASALAPKMKAQLGPAHVPLFALVREAQGSFARRSTRRHQPSSRVASGSRQIVAGASVDLDPVTGEDANVVLPHLARDLCEDVVTSVDAHPEHRARKSLDHFAFKVSDQAALEDWVAHLDQIGVAHSPIRDAELGKFVSFEDPDAIQFDHLSVWSAVRIVFLMSCRAPPIPKRSPSTGVPIQAAPPKTSCALARFTPPL